MQLEIIFIALSAISVAGAIFFKIQSLQSEKKLDNLKNIFSHELNKKDIEIAEHKKDISNLAQINNDLKANNENLSFKLNDANEKISSFSAIIAKNDAIINAQIQKNEELVAMFGAQKQSFKDELNNAMQEILENKIEKFDQNSKNALNELINPFKENIENFKKKLEDSQKENSEKMVALSKEIDFVVKAGLNIANETQNLTKALKGDKQTQGSWGEMILESALERSGLIKNEHYFIQESYRDDSGNIKRPDVVVKLPEERSLIIDSKVSLIDYEKFCSSEGEQAAVFAQNVAKSFKAHIDVLSSKDYSHYHIGTLQYVFMFTPIESAYSLAIKQDANLYEYALSKNVIIVYPSTLVVTLRVVYMYWQKEKADEASLALFLEAGKLYDKICLFLENFDKVGKQLDTLKNSYDQAAVQLFSGSGNIVRRAENLKILGVKTTKSIKSVKSKFLIEDKDLDDSSTD